MANLTITDVLNQLCQKNYFIGSALEENGQQFPPFVLMKWLGASGTDPIRLQRINNNFFNHNKNIQLMLLATAEKVPTRRHLKWNKQEKHYEQIAVEAIMFHYQVDSSTARSVISVLSEQELAELVASYNDTETASEKSKTKTRR